MWAIIAAVLALAVGAPLLAMQESIIDRLCNHSWAGMVAGVLLFAVQFLGWPVTVGLLLAVGL